MYQVALRVKCLENSLIVSASGPLFQIQEWIASDRKHELATLEHLLLALLDDKDAAAVISACDVDIEPLRA